MTRWISLLVALPSLACSTTDDSPPATSESEGSRGSDRANDIAGGSTEDFTGDRDPCTTTTSFELEETTPLGYSGADVLANAQGRFEVPIRWVSLCQQQGLACSSAGSCDGDSPDRPMSALAGTETSVRIEIEARSEPVTVTHQAPGGLSCEPSMSIPVTLRVETADGALAELSAESLGSGSGDTTESTTALSRRVSELQGGLASDGALPGDALFRMVFGFYADKVWMEIDVTTPGDADTLPVPLLSDMLPPFDTCALDMPRDSVER